MVLYCAKQLLGLKKIKNFLHLSLSKAGPFTLESHICVKSLKCKVFQIIRCLIKPLLKNSIQTIFQGGTPWVAELLNNVNVWMVLYCAKQLLGLKKIKNFLHLSLSKAGPFTLESHICVKSLKCKVFQIIRCLIKPLLKNSIQTIFQGGTPWVAELLNNVNVWMVLYCAKQLLGLKKIKNFLHLSLSKAGPFTLESHICVKSLKCKVFQIIRCLIKPLLKNSIQTIFQGGTPWVAELLNNVNVWMVLYCAKQLLGLKKIKNFLHLSLSKAGPFTLESHIRVKSLKCKVFQIIRCLIKPLLKNSIQTIFQGGTPWVAELLNNVNVWMVLYCAKQLLGLKKIKNFLHLSLSKAGPFTLESHICVKSLKCKVFQIIRCLIKPLLKNSIQTIFQGGTPWVAELLNNVNVWMVLYCAKQLLGLKKIKNFLHLSLSKAGPFTLESHICVKSLKCKVFQIIRCLIKPLLKNSIQTIFQGGTPWVAELLNNVNVWMVLYCAKQLLGLKKIKNFLHLSLSKAGPFTLESHICVKSLKCKVFQIIRCLIKPLLKNSTQTIFQGGAPLVAELLNNVNVWMVLYCAKQQ